MFTERFSEIYSGIKVCRKSVIFFLFSSLDSFYKNIYMLWFGPLEIEFQVFADNDTSGQPCIRWLEYDWPYPPSSSNMK